MIGIIDEFPVPLFVFVIFFLGSVNSSITITIDLAVTLLVCSISYHSNQGKVICIPKWLREDYVIHE